MLQGYFCNTIFLQSVVIDTAQMWAMKVSVNFTLFDGLFISFSNDTTKKSRAFRKQMFVL